ncbi:MAG: hypothetical protein AB1Z23_04980 [Eubacteriales bacterium]
MPDLSNSKDIQKDINIENPHVEHIKIVETLYGEIENYRTTVIDKIEKRFMKKFSTKWSLVFAALSVPFTIFLYAILMHPFFLPPFIIISSILTFFIIVFFILHSGYIEIKCKLAIKKQTQFFMYKMDSILKPLGLVNEKYNRNMYSDPNTDYEMEIIKLTKARDAIISLELKEIYSTPYIHYSFTDFLSGKNPTKGRSE